MLIIKNSRTKFKEYSKNKGFKIDKLKIEIAIRLIDKSGEVTLDKIKDIFESVGRD